MAELPIVGRAADMTFSITPYGVQAYVPIIECSSGTYADLYWSNDNERDFHQRRGFLLCLEKHPDAHAKPSQSPWAVWNEIVQQVSIEKADPVQLRIFRPAQ